EIKGRRRTVDYVHDPSIGPPVYQQACFPDRYANLLTHIKLPEIGAIDQGNRAKRHREDAACAFVLLASQTQAPARMAPISRRLISLTLAVFVAGVGLIIFKPIYEAWSHARWAKSKGIFPPAS